MNNSKHASLYCLLLFVVVLISSTSSMFAQQIVEKADDGFVKLWVEAEAGHISSPMKVWYNEKASGGQFIEVLSGNNNTKSAPEDGHITYNFKIQTAGIYKVWGRVIAAMDDENAFWVRMDHEKWIKWKNICVGCKWHWDEVHDNANNDQVVKFYLTQGEHMLTFAYLLDQTRLDKILITNDLNYIPTESGPGVTALFDTSSATPSVKENVLLDASESFSTEGAIVAYQWDFGDGTKASGKSVIHTYNKPGEYSVQLVVTDDKGLKSRLTKTLKVYTDNPVAIFIYSPDRPKKGETVDFDASPSFDPNGKIENYLWDFGDGSVAKGPKVKHSYDSPGEYFVTLTVRDSQGKKEKLTRLVTVITGVPKKVILETDMCLDVDDVGALAVIHALENNKEAELLAVCYNEVHPFAASAIDAINTWYGRGDIPIGIYKKPLFEPDYSPYLEPVSKFPHDLDSKTALSALEVYQQVLAKQPDSSVTIISVGFLNNLSDLLRKNPDLIAKKVKELVIMGGIHNDGFNLVRHNLVSESENVIKNWPTPIVFSTSGVNVLTGLGLKESPQENPVRQGYYKFFHNNFCPRPSWDPLAVLYAVRGLSNYFSMNDTGTGSLKNGFKWRMKPGYRSSLKPLLPPGAYAKIIQDLMLVPPEK